MSSRHLPVQPGLELVRAFFERPPLQHLGLELAVCWVLERLLEGDSYPTALMHDLSTAHALPQSRPAAPHAAPA